MISLVHGLALAGVRNKKLSAVTVAASRLASTLALEHIAAAASFVRDASHITLVLCFGMNVPRLGSVLADADVVLGVGVVDGALASFALRLAGFFTVEESVGDAAAGAKHVRP